MRRSSYKKTRDLGNEMLIENDVWRPHNKPEIWQSCLSRVSTFVRIKKSGMWGFWKCEKREDLPLKWGSDPTIKGPSRSSRSSTIMPWTTRSKDKSDVACWDQRCIIGASTDRISTSTINWKQVYNTRISSGIWTTLDFAWRARPISFMAGYWPRLLVA